MAVRRIVITGDPVLHTPTREVTTVTDELRVLVEDLFDTMAAAHGVGLAANQVGVPLRVFVYDCPDDDGQRVHRGLVVNPRLRTSERPEGMPDPEDDWEGCLSVPGEAFPTGRADWAQVTGTDLDGAPVEITGTGFFARCLQHETDHLDGILYTDRLLGRHKRESRRAIRARGWEKDGIASWNPATMTAEQI